MSSNEMESLFWVIVWLTGLCAVFCAAGAVAEVFAARKRSRPDPNWRVPYDEQVRREFFRRR